MTNIQVLQVFLFFFVHVAAILDFESGVCDKPSTFLLKMQNKIQGIFLFIFFSLIAA